MLLNTAKKISTIQWFDMFPKYKKSVGEQTKFGACVTLFALFMGLTLTLLEFYDWWYPVRMDSLFFQNEYYNQDDRVNLKFQIAFFALPCSMLDLDLVEREEHKVAIVNGLTKTPIFGNFRDGIGGTTEDQIWSNIVSTTINPNNLKKRCGSCAFPSPNSQNPTCCDTCLELQTHFALIGRDISDSFRYPQCQTIGTEGCILTGDLEISQGYGNFHFAVGSPHPGISGHHHHWPAPLRQLGWNISHHIHTFSFGEKIPDMVNPLEGFHVTELDQAGQQLYFLKIIPTTYKPSHYIHTNQYAATTHHVKVDASPNAAHVELPGVFFKYETSGIVIAREINAKFPLSHMIVRALAVLGGVWSAFRMFMSCVKSVVG